LIISLHHVVIGDKYKEDEKEKITTWCEIVWQIGYYKWNGVEH
tara:strand:+ start:651 stop:779 length:129 start_codon:yes stop_codon:yes gene_type:complete